MKTKLIEDIAAAVLYEGYLLYPYRASATKNRQRWNFGVLYPRGYADQQAGSDAWSMQTECLLRAEAAASPSVRVRFLHLIPRAADGPTWQGAVEREMAAPTQTLSELVIHDSRHTLTFPPQENQRAVEAAVTLKATLLDEGLYKLNVTIENTADSRPLTRDEALSQALVSTHTILGVDQGEFVSLLDPPDSLRQAASECANLGAWPVLVGEEGDCDAMLSSPIILYDYPKIAPESPGALFDGTEIDEILTLRILTLTDEEKAAMEEGDERARHILERTESMPPEQFMKMHGVMRSLPGAREEMP